MKIVHAFPFKCTIHKSAFIMISIRIVQHTLTFRLAMPKFSLIFITGSIL